jgi:hypothetical protein
MVLQIYVQYSARSSSSSTESPQVKKPVYNSRSYIQPNTNQKALSSLVSFRFSDKIFRCISYFTHLSHVSCSSNTPLFDGINYISCRSRWPRDLRRRSMVARLLILWVRIPHVGMDVFLLWVLCVSGRGLCDGPITRLEESYWVSCFFVCDLETSWMRRMMRRNKRKKYILKI